MRVILVVAAVVFAMPVAEAQVARRDRLEHRFENDIRANNEAMSRRFSGPNNQIETQNMRLRERLNSTGASRALRSR